MEESDIIMFWVKSPTFIFSTNLKIFKNYWMRLSRISELFRPRSAHRYIRSEADIVDSCLAVYELGLAVRVRVRVRIRVSIHK